MAARQSVALDAVIVEEDIEFTLVDLCRACGAERSYLIELIREGVLEPIGRSSDSPPEDWRFSGPALRTARVARRLDQSLDLGPSGAALVLDLLNEIEQLRIRLRRAGL